MMKAMVLRGARDLVLDQVPRPEIHAGQVLVRVTHSGVCGTDFKIYDGSIPVKYPRIMGHEFIGEIVKGSGRDGTRPGERVLVDPILFCGQCFQCRSGQTNLCSHGGLVGRDTDGGFAEYVAVPASHVYRLPKDIDNWTAALVQVTTTALHGQRLANLSAGEAVVVLGLGVTGQLHVQLAKARGASPVIGITRSASRCALAERLGADMTLQPGPGVMDRVLEATQGRGGDLVIESTGVLSSVAEAIHLARSGGRLLLYGITTAKEGALPFYQIYYKELLLIGARAAKGEDYAGCIDLLQHGLLRLDPLVTNIVPLTGLKSALEMLGSNDAGRMKILLMHN